MYKVILLFFWPSKLASLAASHGQESDTASGAINRIRASYLRAIITIILLSLISIGCAYIINQIGGLSIETVTLLRFLCSAFIALAVLAKLSWEIQTWDGDTIPEQVNSYIFQFFYKVGVIGMLCSLLINT